MGTGGLRRAVSGGKMEVFHISKFKLNPQRASTYFEINIAKMFISVIVTRKGFFINHGNFLYLLRCWKMFVCVCEKWMLSKSLENYGPDTKSRLHPGVGLLYC